MLVYLYSCLVLCFCIIYCVLCFVFLFCWCCGSLAPNEDTVRSTCGDGEPCSYFLKNILKIFVLLVIFENSVPSLIGFDPLNVDY